MVIQSLEVHINFLILIVSSYLKWIKFLFVKFDFSFFVDILTVINDFHAKFGGPGKFWLGNRLFVYIDDPKHFEMILNSPESMDKGESYDLITESVGYGLITLKCNFFFKFKMFYLMTLVIHLFIWSGRMEISSEKSKSII